MNAWYSTAYEPLFDDQNKVCGILYVGIKQENLTALRQGILDTTVGKTGYVFVLGGKGQEENKPVKIGRDGQVRDTFPNS